jgi:hypothetical protein
LTSTFRLIQRSCQLLRDEEVALSTNPAVAARV